jgi:hypothetical protein
MVTTENLKAYSNARVHSEIEKLTNEQRQRVKTFIDELIQQTNRDFEISELKLLSDRIEIGVNYKLTMI